jgi:hypothetical protein
LVEKLQIASKISGIFIHAGKREPTMNLPIPAQLEQPMLVQQKLDL